MRRPRRLDVEPAALECLVEEPVAREPERARRVADRAGPRGRARGRRRPEAVIHSLAAGLAHTAIAARPPGRRTRRISPIAASMSGTSIRPQRQRTPSKDASSNDSDAASSTANATSSRPSSVALRRATSTISGATSEVTSRPPGSRCGSARNPVSPGPAAELEDGLAPLRARAARRGAPRPGASPSRSARAAAPSLPRRSARPGFLLADVYAAAPASCGITCVPYASSVSSWPCVIR